MSERHHCGAHCHRPWFASAKGVLIDLAPGSVPRRFKESLPPEGLLETCLGHLQLRLPPGKGLLCSHVITHKFIWVLGNMRVLSPAARAKFFN